MTTARLLDLTRSLRRVGRTVTGIDRVERAYLEHLLADEVPLFGLVRTAFGFLLLDQPGLIAFQARLKGQVAWGGADILSRLARGRDDLLQRAESDLRRLAVARRPVFGLKKMLGQGLPAGFVYFNVGHSDLEDRTLSAIKGAGGRIVVMLHDVIPLEHPHFQRPGTVASFRDRIAAVGRRADRVIYNSQDTCRRAEEKLAEMGRVPHGLVATLGVTEMRPDASALPPGLPPDRPYFVTVGTIEPRKNHRFLLDLWDQMGPAAPPLLICGSRGWENRDVFARLDALNPESTVEELSALDDGALAFLIQNSAGALFPTLAEGFGLPQVEAIGLGTRVLCNDLGVLREILGTNAHYIPVNEPSLWLNKVKQWELDQSGTQGLKAQTNHTWSEHFKTVLRLR